MPSAAATFARNLHAIREEQELSISEAARRAGLTRRHYLYLERGERSPVLENVVKLAEGFGVTFDRLFSGVSSKIDALPRPKKRTRSRPR